MSPSRPRNFFLILILGALSTVTPFSIDLYLPAFPQIAEAMNTTPARVALSLSSYFIAFSIGQLLYGPLLDRFGRKKPLFIGLVLYLIATLGCMTAKTVEALIVLRFLQALGGCVAQVASIAMVRDFFPVREASKIFSLLTLILGVSPLLAPTIGGFVSTAYGWQSIFLLLAAVVFVILMVEVIYLPEGHQPDPSVSLKFKPIFSGFISILKDPQFYTYAFAGAFSFAGLFVYVAGSPIIFMDVFHVSAKLYGGIFAFLSVGFIGGNQVNIFLTRKFSSERIFRAAIWVQVVVGTLFWIGTYYDWYGLTGTIIMLFLLLSCLGLTSPNGSAIALAPFSKNAGSASALLGFIQLGCGALGSTAIGLLEVKTIFPIVSVLFGTAILGVAMLFIGRRQVKGELFAGHDDASVFIH